MKTKTKDVIERKGIADFRSHTFVRQALSRE